MRCLFVAVGPNARFIVHKVSIMADLLPYNFKGLPERFYVGDLHSSQLHNVYKAYTDVLLMRYGINALKYLLILFLISRLNASSRCG